MLKEKPESVDSEMLQRVEVFHHTIRQGVFSRNVDDRSDSLFDRQKLDIKGQSSVFGHSGRRIGTIGQVCGNDQSTLTSDLHTGKTNVPAFDDLTFAKLEGERLAFLVGYAKLVVISSRGYLGNTYNQRLCHQQIFRCSASPVGCRS